MLCVLISYISSGTYSLKATPNDRFFEKLFMAIFFTLRVFARNLPRGNHRRNTFCILLWCLAWGSNPGFTSNKLIHYLIDRVGRVVITNFICNSYSRRCNNQLYMIYIWLSLYPKEQFAFIFKEPTVIWLTIYVD